MNTFSKHACTNTHIQGDIQGETYIHNEVGEDSMELKANLVLKESSRWEILFDKGFKTAYHYEGPVEPSRATAPNKPLLQAQQTFSCFLFKGSHANTLQSLPNQSSQIMCVYVCVREWVSIRVVCVCVRVYMYISWASHTVYTHTSNTHTFLNMRCKGAQL